MERLDPVRAAAGHIALFGLLGATFGVLLVVTEQPGALLVGGGTAVVGSAYAVQSSIRLRCVLGEFASQVPGEPTADHSPWICQSLSWDDPELVVEGATASRALWLGTLTVRADGHSQSRSPTRPREAAREALAFLDREPALDSWGERLPSPDPAHAAVRTTGVLAAVLPVLLVGVDGSDPTSARGAVLVGVGVALAGGGGVGRGVTIRRIRSGFQTLDDGMRAGGVRIEWIDHLGGYVRLRYRVHTDAGAVELRVTSHPWGRVAPALDGVDETRLPDLSDCGRAIAAAVRGTPG